MPGKSILRALAHRNFRLFFAGQTLSLVGTWTQSTAMPWLVARLSGEAFVVGLAGFSAQLPSFLLPPFAGVLTDRWNRHRLLLATQTLAMLQAFALAVLVLAGHVRVWQIVVLNFTLSAVNAFDMTARQTFLGDMLDRKDDLANAIALNSSMVNGARLFGPALAALLIASVGEEACFFINGLSFLAVLAALLAMRLPPRPPQPAPQPVWHGLREGFDYVRRSTPIRAVLWQVALVSLVGLPYAMLLPLYVQQFYGGAPRVYGLLMTAPGVGAFAAGVYLAWAGLDGILTRLWTSPILAGLCLIGFSLAPNLWLAVPLLFGAGVCFLTLLNQSNTLLQTCADEDKRGRVLSFYTLAFLGMAPLGSLMIGSVASAIGVVNALRWGGVVIALGGLMFAVRMPRWRDEVCADLKLRKPAVAPPTFPARSELEARADQAVEADEVTPAPGA
jgi:MFS family permease